MRLLYIPILLLLFFSCNNLQPKKVDDGSLKNSIHTVLDNWHQAATDANFEDYFSKMDSISVFVGTDASENWKKSAFKNFSKPYFDKGKAWSFTPKDRNIYIDKSGKFAWFDELLETWMGACRGSGVLELKNNVWLIKHYVLSVTVPNDDIQKIIAVKKEKDSVYLQSLKKD